MPPLNITPPKKNSMITEDEGEGDEHEFGDVFLFTSSKRPIDLFRNIRCNRKGGFAGVPHGERPMLSLSLRLASQMSKY